MKTEKETKKVKKNIVAISKSELPEIVDHKTLTLDDIEKKMVEIAMDDSNDIVTCMINERKMAMLEKVANVKFKRMQYDLERRSNTIDVNETQPITVKFISSKTDEQKVRLERIDNEIMQQHKIKQDA